MATHPQRALSRQANRHSRLTERIQVGKIIKRVDRCARGREEMTNIELQAAKLLINKIIPDAKPIEVADPLDGAKDISAANPHHLLSMIEGQAKRLDDDKSNS